VEEEEGAPDGKTERHLEKISKELEIFPNHQREDEVLACVKRQHAF
jgi:hypothetical protein